jgi:hypothetical protein
LFRDAKYTTTWEPSHKVKKIINNKNRIREQEEELSQFKGRIPSQVGNSADLYRSYDPASYLAKVEQSRPEDINYQSKYIIQVNSYLF